VTSNGSPTLPCDLSVAPNLLMKVLGSLFLLCYRFYSRVAGKCFSVLISGAFAHYGRRSVIMHPLRLSGEGRIAIGNSVFVGPGSWLQTLPEGDNESIALSIGNRTSIVGHCVISAIRQVTVEEDVLIARNVYISDHIHRYTDAPMPIVQQGVDKIAPVVIKRGAWLGQNVVVCPGVTIGRGAVIGANAVVTRDIPEFSVAVGAPARVVKTFCTGMADRSPHVSTAGDR
jgi:acetyltransferase-like isoleucine patch superfamily enzyme